MGFVSGMGGAIASVGLPPSQLFGLSRLAFRSPLSQLAAAMMAVSPASF